MNTKKDRLALAVIASIFLHLLLIGLFLLGSLFTKTVVQSAGGNGGDTEILEAVMVDTAQVAAEYGKLKAKDEKSLKKQPKDEPKKDSVPQQAEKDVEAIELARQTLEQEKRLEAQRQQELARQAQIKQAELKKKQQEEAAQKKQAEAARLHAEAEAKRLEALAKQAQEKRKAEEAERKRKQEAENKLKAEQEAKAKREKAEKEAKEKAEKEAKLKAQEAKEKAEKAAKEQAEKAAKLKAEREAKAKADKEAKAKEAARALELLEGGGNSQGGNRRAGTQGSGGNAAHIGGMYASQIRAVLRPKFNYPNNIGDKSCVIHINIDANGFVLNTKVVSGDRDVCASALGALKQTPKLPKPPAEVFAKIQTSGFPITFDARFK